MAVHHDVDGIFAKNAEIDLRAYGLGGIEEDVLDLGGDHGAAPAVCQRSAHPVKQDVLVVVVDAHGTAVHHLDHLAVDAAGDDSELAPELLPLGRRTRDHGELALLLAEHLPREVCQGLRHLRVALPVHLESELDGEPAQLEGVLDEVPPLALGREMERVNHVPAVVGVGGRSRGDHAREVAGDDGVGIGPAGAEPWFAAERVDPARAHVADPAADAELAEAALRLLLVPPVPGRLEVLLLGNLDHLQGGLVNALLNHHSLAR